MCVIIHRPANITFPFEKLKAACIANADGFGIAFTDRGRLEVRKEFTPKGNDPELLAKLMDEVKDRDMFVHLRLRSIGEKNLDNCHPFMVHQDDQYAIALMHNGTMSQFNRNDGKTDSETWGREILLPFVQKFEVEDKALLDDTDFQRLISHLVPSGSKIAMFDNLGHHFIANKSAGTIVDGCWASNEYSFRTSTPVYHRQHDVGGYHKTTSGVWAERKEAQQTSDQEVTKEWEVGRVYSTEHKGFVKRQKTSVPAVTSATVPAVAKESVRSDPFKSNQTGGPASGTTSKSDSQTQSSGTNAIVIVPPKEIVRRVRKPFCHIAKIKDLSVLSDLSRQDILDLVTMYPEDMTLCIMDLLDELYEAINDDDDDAVYETVTDDPNDKEL